MTDTARKRKTPYDKESPAHIARRAYDRNFTGKGVLLGAAAEALYNTGGNELMIWLANNTPKGATILEMLAAIALDTMHDEQDKQSAEQG